MVVRGIEQRVHKRVMHLRGNVDRDATARREIEALLADPKRLLSQAHQPRPVRHIRTPARPIFVRLAGRRTRLLMLLMLLILLMLLMAGWRVLGEARAEDKWTGRRLLIMSVLGRRGLRNLGRWASRRVWIGRGAFISRG
jgi:hypothetical protein